MATYGRQTIRPTFKGRAVQVVLVCLTPTDMTDSLSRNIGDCRWVTCMSNHTGGDARVAENDLKKIKHCAPARQRHLHFRISSL